MMKKLLLFCSLILASINSGFAKDCNEDLKDVLRDYVKIEKTSDSLTQRLNCIFHSKNQKDDSNKNRRDYSQLFPIANNLQYKVTGKIKYYRLIKKKYNYNVTLNARENTITIGLKIHTIPSKSLKKKIRICKDSLDTKCYFYQLQKKYYPNSLDELYTSVDKKIAQAQETWNKSAPEGVKFDFKRSTSKQDANYSIKLDDKYGAIYDKFIWYKFGGHVWSHEIGHMLGLGEEYSAFTANVMPIHSWKNKLFNKGESLDLTRKKDMKCNLDSFMCLRETIYPYHYKEILDRIK